MPETLRWRALVVVLSSSALGCSGTRLYERANSAATAGEYSRAVAYDALASNDRPAQPPTFDQQYADHVARYTEQMLVRLGPPAIATADAQAAEVRGLLAWARTQKQEAAIGPLLSARLGELAHVRWPRITALSDAARLDEAVVAGRALVEDTPADLGERAALAQLEGKARAAHEAAVSRLAEGGDDHAGAIALHERFARQMGGASTAAGTRAEAALTRKTGMAPKVDAINAGDCEAAVSRLRSLLPSGGDTPVAFAFRFGRCASRHRESTVEAWRTTPVEEEVSQTVSDLVPRQNCRSVRTGSATICDGHDFNGRVTCHQEETTGQKCESSYEAVEHTERVRRTRNVQTKYRINSLTLDIDYQVTLSTDIDEKHYEVDSTATATSGSMSKEDASPALGDAQSLAIDDLAGHLRGATSALAAFARKTQTDRLRREAQAALAAGQPGRAESLYVECSIVEGVPSPELKPTGISAAQLRAAIGNVPWEQKDGASPPPAFPTVAEAEILEDAHERTDALTLSAEARAGYSGAVIGGISNYTTSAPGDSATGGFVAAVVTGAQEVGTRFTGGGGSIHLLGNFDGRTQSMDFSFDLGLGLKVAQIYLMPVGGLAIGTSTHASPSDPGFRPNAALRATAFDAVYGGQLTVALPYPANLTINAQLVRTAPVPLDDFKQWTTRLYGTIGYHFSSAVEISVFGRYWELDTDSVKPLDFFGGNGHDHRLVTVGLGIGGTSDKFLSKLFGGGN